MVVPAVVPSALFAVAMSRPALMVVSPEYVLFPPNTTVPAPLLVKLDAPLITAETSRSSVAVPSLIVNVRLAPSPRLPVMVDVVAEALAVSVPPSVSVPLPVVTVPPVSFRLPITSEKLFRSSTPVPVTVTVFEGISLLASDWTSPLEIVTAPLRMFFPLVFARSVVPPLTISPPV